MSRIYLSPPHMGGAEQAFVAEVFRTNWIAPVGPQVDAFEREFAAATGAAHAAAVSTGTAAIHLALRLLEVGPGDDVFCSTLTFVATANPILQQGARPVFIDSDRTSWNLDPALLRSALEERAARGALPKAVIVVHLYGQSADLDPIMDACDAFGVPVIEDAAEALGASYHGRRPSLSPGTLGRFGVYSFNGNKIITTSGGGMLVSADGAMIERARFLATQARDPAPHYQHSVAGYNYRMSGVLAAIGRGQLQVLDERVAARRRNFDRYVQALGDLPGLAFMPEAPFGRSTRWLTCVTIDPRASGGVTREDVRLALDRDQIEARPVWKPLHLQPLFAGAPAYGGTVAEQLFADGLCLPSGSSLTDAEFARVVARVRAVWEVRR